jgi:hypothetical protein
MWLHLHVKEYKLVYMRACDMTVALRYEHMF